MQSNTTFNIWITKRCCYIAWLNNDMFRPLYRPSSGCTLSYYKASYTIYDVFVLVNEISCTSTKCYKCARDLISSFHCAFLKSITFIGRLMYSIVQNSKVKIYVVSILKYNKTIKNHSEMFRIVCDPSSGGAERAWLKLLVIFSCAWCVAPCTHTAGSKLRCQTPTKHTKISRVISVKHVQHSLMMDRKRSETFRSDF